MKHLINIISIFAVLLLSSCGKKDPKEMAIAEGGVISPEGDGFSLTAPDHWKFIKDLHDEAGLQIGNERREEYFIVLSELKEDFAGDLNKYGDVTAGNVADSLLNASASEPKEVSLGGLAAIQQQITGGIENTNVSYLHTVLETDTRYHQIVCWTLKSKESVAIPLFEKVLKSLKQTPETDL